MKKNCLYFLSFSHKNSISDMYVNELKYSWIIFLLVPILGLYMLMGFSWSNLKNKQAYIICYRNSGSEIHAHTQTQIYCINDTYKFFTYNYTLATSSETDLCMQVHGYENKSYHTTYCTSWIKMDYNYNNNFQICS